MRHVAYLIALLAAASLGWAVILPVHREAMVSAVFEATASSTVGDWRHSDGAAGERDATLRTPFYVLKYVQVKLLDGRTGPAGGSLHIYSRDVAIWSAVAGTWAVIIVMYLSILWIARRPTVSG